MAKRRDFLKNTGFGSFGMVFPFSKKAKTQEEKTVKTRNEPVELGKDVEIDLTYDGEEFLGLGAVKINGVSMRNGERPMFVDIQSPDAVKLVEFTVIDRKVSESEIRLKFRAKQKPGGTMD